MKLTKIFETVHNILNNEEILEEGLRFGSTEKRLVDQEARDIIVGIEYEYHVDDENVEGGFGGDNEDRWENEAWRDAVYERAVELAQERLNELEEEWKDSYVDSEMDDKEVGTITSELYRIKDAYYHDMSEIDDLLETDIQNGESAMSGWDSEKVKSDTLGFEDESELQHFVTMTKLFIGASGSFGNIENAAHQIDWDYKLEDFNYYLEWDSNFMDGQWGTFQDEATNYNNFCDELDNYSNLIDTMQEFIDKDFVPEDDDFYDEVIDVVESIQYEFNYNDIEANASTFKQVLEEIYGMSGSDGDWDDVVRKGLEEVAESAWDDFGKDSVMDQNDINFDDIYETPFWDEAAEDVDYDDYREGGPVGSREAWVEAQLSDSTNQWGVDYHDIAEVTTDVSVENGVEVISEALPLKDALNLMKHMFDHIQDVGSTSNVTGMHVNMSIRGLDFGRDNFNPAKLLFLMDENYLQREEGFPARNWSQSIYQAIDNDDIIDMAISKNAGDLLISFDSKIHNHLVKGKSINITSTRASKMSERRVEFRFFGGTNYEDRYDEMEYEIYRTAYMMLASYSESFGNKEYLKKVVQFLDKKSNEYFNENFGAIVKNLRTKDFENVRDADGYNTRLNRVMRLDWEIYERETLTDYNDKDWFKHLLVNKKYGIVLDVDGDTFVTNTSTQKFLRSYKKIKTIRSKNRKDAIKLYHQEIGYSN